jgi:hypothetical protein
VGDIQKIIKQVVVELMFTTRIREALGLNPGWITGYRDRLVSRVSLVLKQKTNSVA